MNTIEDEKTRAIHLFSGKFCPKCTASFELQLPEIHYAAKPGEENLIITCWLCGFKRNVLVPKPDALCDCQQPMTFLGSRLINVTEETTLENLHADTMEFKAELGEHRFNLYRCSNCGHRKVVQTPE